MVAVLIISMGLWAIANDASAVLSGESVTFPTGESSKGVVTHKWLVI